MVVVTEQLFFSLALSVTDLPRYADQGSRNLGYEHCVPRAFRFSSTRCPCDYLTLCDSPDTILALTVSVLALTLSSL